MHSCASIGVDCSTERDGDLPLSPVNLAVICAWPVSQELHNQARQEQIEVNTTEVMRKESPTKKHNSDLHQTWEKRRFITAKPLFIDSIPIAASNNFNQLNNLRAALIIRHLCLNHSHITSSQIDRNSKAQKFARSDKNINVSRKTAQPKLARVFRGVEKNLYSQLHFLVCRRCTKAFGPARFHRRRACTAQLLRLTRHITPRVLRTGAIIRD